MSRILLVIIAILVAAFSRGQAVVTQYLGSSSGGLNEFRAQFTAPSKDQIEVFRLALPNITFPAEAVPNGWYPQLFAGFSYIGGYAFAEGWQYDNEFNPGVNPGQPVAPGDTSGWFYYNSTESPTGNVEFILSGDHPGDMTGDTNTYFLGVTNAVPEPSGIFSIVFGMFVFAAWARTHSGNQRS